MPESILVINTGSSSLKFGLYTPTPAGPQLTHEGLADNIGHDHATITLKDASGKTLRSETSSLKHQADAFDQATAWLREFAQVYPTAIGHRVVHGGPRLTAHQRITPELIAELKACIHFAPLHIPLSLELIERAYHTYPGVPQYACFDTAFHTTIPEAAARFPLPRSLFDEGIRRYGFHGLSYESIVHQLGDQPPSRAVIAHLGSGASLVALKDGSSIDTTMGLTPTGGIPMATRSGDLDPGVLLFLMRVKHMDADALEQLLNRESGLKALSGGISDMRELESSGTPEARLAIDVFTTAIRKVIAAYTAELGGIDLLIFSGGIGEHSARIRSAASAGITAEVRIIASQEDLQIARHTLRLNSQLETRNSKL